MSQTAVVTHQKAIRKDNPAMKVIGRVLLYTVLIAMALFTLIPFVWMLSSSLKLDQEVFQYPIRWIPETFHWENYRVIWERVSLLTYFKNTAIIALAVTFLQTLTSSFAAYAFAKLRFKGRDLLFVGGYQVIKKWLSYREHTLLGRGLKLEEMTEVQHMARRIAALLLLAPKLDENYNRVKQATFTWPK